MATTLRVGELEMDLIGRGVRRDGKPIDLQPREFQLLDSRAAAGQSVTRTMLLEKVWNWFDHEPMSSTCMSRGCASWTRASIARC